MESVRNESAEREMHGAVKEVYTTGNYFFMPENSIDETAFYTIYQKKYHIESKDNLGLYRTYHVSYPELVGVDAIVNQIIKETAIKSVVSFEAEAVYLRESIGGSFGEFDGGQIMEYTIPYNSDKVISILLYGSSGIGKVTYGRSELEVLNIDLQRGKILTDKAVLLREDLQLLDMIKQVDDAPMPGVEGENGYHLFFNQEEIQFVHLREVSARDMGFGIRGNVPLGFGIYDGVAYDEVDSFWDFNEAYELSYEEALYIKDREYKKQESQEIPMENVSLPDGYTFQSYEYVSTYTDFEDGHTDACGERVYKISYPMIENEGINQENLEAINRAITKAAIECVFYWEIDAIGNITSNGNAQVDYRITDRTDDSIIITFFGEGTVDGEKKELFREVEFPIT